ncbi:AhpC/TSA antioxidant enzyme-domain-containing protein [Kockovaella imperatae]|uniref:AhpC/TSA antioxidant enzyme-domain-containing protein n=1 Tax=Kockovaella imperatae TaxID=4999 RepID=A0A1Y1UFV4_9TREE|nr:AhpC/TSA antioxidant enzyme-domain-containing protein [Kockovaella imperatae]ORX36902.1 AhpC/TSA antioxidant enzyme-domain-containing protein [Kockovaella imperatae]
MELEPSIHHSSRHFIITKGSAITAVEEDDDLQPTWSNELSPLSTPKTLRGSISSYRSRESLTSTANTSQPDEEPITPLSASCEKTLTVFERQSSIESFRYEDQHPPSPRSSPKSINSKRNARKLPPRLTESLENLSLSISPPSRALTFKRPSIVLEMSPIYQLDVDKSLPDIPANPSNEILPMHRVELPKMESKRSMSSLNRTRVPVKGKTTRKPVKYGPTGNRSSWAPSSSSSASTNLVTPGTSMLRSTESTCSTANFCEFDDFHRAWAEPEHNMESPVASGSRPKIKESRKQRKARRKAEAQAFDEFALPSMRSLYDAGNLEVIAEDGERVRFGNLVRDRKTIVIFIRHWFCSLCAQYMQSIVSQVRPEALEAADVNLIIIGNGSVKMLPGYKNKAFNCPFPMYTDPSLELYRALGQTRQSGDAGADEDAGDYLVQSVMQQTVSTVKRATMMPLRNPGHFTQLGGEFIFDGALNCTYAHRMTTTRSHAPIRDVCAEAGVRLEWVHYEPGEAPPPVHRPSFNSMLDFAPPMPGVRETPRENAEGTVPDAQEPGIHFGSPVDSRRDSIEMTWKSDRDGEIERIKNLRRARRSGAINMGSLKTLDGQNQNEDGEVEVVGEDEVLDLGGDLRALGITVN